MKRHCLIDKYSGNPERDQRHAERYYRVMAALTQQRLEKHGKAGINDSVPGEFRWQIEELRISLFAQEFEYKCSIFLSLQKLWEEVTIAQAHAAITGRDRF